MFCSSCGAKNVAESNYCRQCGLKLAPPQTARVSEEAFDRAMPEDEKVTALLELAYRRRKENDLPAAIALCDEVINLRPDSTTAHGLLGQLYEQQGNREKAIAQYEQVLKQNPGSIADRVKLDDLREGRTPAPRKAPIPLPVIVDPNGAPMRGAMIWGVGIVALIMLSGAALAVMFNRHGTDSGTTNTVTNNRSQSAGPQPTEPGATAGTQVATKSQDHPIESVNPAAAGFGASSYLPTYAIPGAPIQITQPPVYIYPPNYYGARQAAAPAPVPVRQARSTVQPASITTESDGGERIHLSVSGDSSRDTGNRDNGSGSSGSVHLQSQGPELSIINVKPSKRPVDPNASMAAGSDSAAYIAAGLDHYNKMDYAGATTAFKKALPGANDDTAYVYEQLGHCYQSLTQNANAVQMFQRALDEYKKLQASGRQMERASRGITICETGIKICSSE